MTIRAGGDGSLRSPTPAQTRAPTHTPRAGVGMPPTRQSVADRGVRVKGRRVKGGCGLRWWSMLQPIPTSRIDPKLVRGVVVGEGPRPGFVRIAIPDTSYELHLVTSEPVRPGHGGRVVGTIHARAKRIDVVDTGGRYVEPVFGRPRRVQGTVIAVEGDELVVNAGVPIHCRPTDPRQKASEFEVGDLVSFDVMDGAEFRVAR